MNREKRGHKTAWPSPIGDVPQKNKKQKRRDRVKKNIREMMTAGFEIEELAIDHVRNERERMPVAGPRVDKRLDESRQTQSRSDQRISVDVSFVVVVNKVVP